MIEAKLVENFRPLVNKIARQNYINITVDEEDLQQELWKKVQELLPTLRTLDEDHAFKYVKVCLNNLVKDIKFSESRIPGASQYSLMEIDFSEIIGGEISSIFEKISDHNQEDYMMARELHELIKKWASNQSTLIKQLINERIEPSPEMELAWEERLKTSPRCKNAKSIPIWSMLKILGINEKEYYKKIRIELADYLIQHGYAV